MSSLTLLLPLLLCASPEPPRFTLRVGASTAWLHDEGGALVDLLPVLVVRSGERQARHYPFRLSAAESGPREGGWRLVALAEAPEVAHRLVIEHHEGDSRLHLVLTSTTRRVVALKEEWVRFRTGRFQRVEALDFAYRLKHVRSTTFLGGLTPRQVHFDARLSLIGGEGIEGAWVHPDKKGRYEVRLELEHEENHPFSTYEACTTHVDLKARRTPLPAEPREIGTRRRLEAEWIVGSAHPLRVARYPNGYRAAIVLTDHADQSDTKRLEAFAFGSTGALKRGEVGSEYPGFVNRGLSYTKTIFVEKRGPHAPQFEETAYRALLDTIQARGVEIGLHSVTGEDDPPSRVEALVKQFRGAYSGRVWIDHQPDTNCEAITNRGSSPGSRYILDILAKHNVRLLWTARDLILSRGSLNLLDPGSSNRRRSVIFKHPRFPGFWLFSTSWLFLKRVTLLKLFNAHHLDRLASERGLLLGHVYLETWRRQGRLKGRGLIKPSPTGFQIRPEVDALFSNLAKRQTTRQLWMAPLGPLVTHMEAALRARINYSPEGIHLRSSTPLKGLTLLPPANLPESTLCVEARSDAPIAKGREGSVWFDLDGVGRGVKILDAEGRVVAPIQPASVAWRPVESGG
ncbi:hypothetical protein KJ940_17225 [Myxococcota bacterium]|nr:hypothetical protein [Myxococcota bacterium]